MKRVLVLLFAMVAIAAAQQVTSGGPPRQGVTLNPTPPPVTANVTQPLVPITHSDLYCSGFMSKDLVPRAKFVEGGLNSPNSTRFAGSDLIFLRGTDYQPGTRVSIVRELKDPNRYFPFKGEQNFIRATGRPYKDLGYADIIEIRGTDTAVARVEFSCDAIVTGDLVVPFVARPAVSYRLRSTMDRFPAEPPRAIAYIVLHKDFDQYFGMGAKIYLNSGANRGFKPGDYFRVVRGYQKSEMDDADASSYSATVAEDTQKHPPKLASSKNKDMPRRVVGEVVLLSVQPSTSVAMVTFSLEEIHIGDGIERESPAAPPLVQPAGGK